MKHDCVFGGVDLDMNEISVVSDVRCIPSLSLSLQYFAWWNYFTWCFLNLLDQVLKQHPIVYSLSPGTGATPAMAKDVSGLANMYRVTGDDWDSWGDVASHFDVSR